MRWPVFILSLGRADAKRTTADLLLQHGIESRIVVEPHEESAYSARWGRERIIVKPDIYQTNFDPLDRFSTDSMTLGPGPARNCILATAREEGHDWYWSMDDDVTRFMRHHRDRSFTPAENLVDFFIELENDITQYKNVAIGGPRIRSQYEQQHRFIKNRAVYGRCFLHRTTTGINVRGRFNEDTVLSLEHLIAGWCTMIFNTHQLDSPEPTTKPGGCTETVYQYGRELRFKHMAAAFPKFVGTRIKNGKYCSKIQWSKHFGRRPLIPDPNYSPTG